MNDKIIKFYAPKEWVDAKLDYPKPIKLNVPEWYKKLDYGLEKKQIKGCIPFLDSLTTGYVLSLPQDIIIEHNIKHPDTGKPDSFYRNAFEELGNFLRHNNINVNTGPEIHTIEQLGGKEGKCPFIKKNKELPIYKILNPWIIKTPPGYSCLFVPILNNGDDRFTPVAGIVDTDTYENYINFPIIINGDKYPTLMTTFKAGTPYVQVIPFKRDNWKMEIHNLEKDERWNRLGIVRKFLHNYKTRYWNKKSWK